MDMPPGVVPVRLTSISLATGKRTILQHCMGRDGWILYATGGRGFVATFDLGARSSDPTRVVGWVGDQEPS